MIEIVYRTEENEVSTDKMIKTPKNYKQVGDIDGPRKIYIEDYVMSFIKTPASDREEVKYGILVGYIKRGGGNTYVFVKGAVQVRNVMENSIIFDDDIWIKLYEDMRSYFNEYEVVGWYVSVPYSIKKDLSNICKLHLDNFAGNDKTCLFIDREDKEENFYVYNNGIMERQAGYYIYYERNEDMLDYMYSNSDVEALEEKAPSTPVTTYREIMNTSVDQESTPWNKKIPAYVQTASTFLIVVLLIGIVAMMNNYGQIQNVRVGVEGLAKEIFGLHKEDSAGLAETTEKKVQVQEVDGKVKPTESGDESDKLTEKPTKNDEKKTEKQTKEKKTEEKKTEKPTKSQKQTTPPEQVTTQVSVESVKPNHHVVQKGESLLMISRRYYGNTTKVKEIMEANNIENGDLIIEGQKLKLP